MKCPKCNIDLRDKDISHSDFGQYIHDRYANTFFFLDIDGIIFKLKTRILRIIEEKKPNQKLKPSQEAVLPLLTESIEYLIDIDKLHWQSGVFTIHGEMPYDKSIIIRLHTPKTLMILTYHYLLVPDILFIVKQAFPEVTIGQIERVLKRNEKEQDIKFNPFVTGNEL